MEDVPLSREQILLFARYEFHQGKPVCEAYQNFCKILGNNAMTYNNFDYWFYRFKNGEFDLDHDRSKDPKKPGLLDIPVEVAEMIIGKLTLEEKLSLRNVSQRLRETVDNMKYSVGELCLIIRSRYGNSLEFDNERLKFKNWKQLLKVFLIFMNWPRMTVECLDMEEFYLNEQNTTQVLEAFKSLNHQIPVAKFHISPGNDQILAVLSYLKPGILEDITIICKPYSTNLNEIVKLDQWKQAKHCDIRQVDLPIESLFHFESIRITFGIMSRMSIAIEEFEKLKNAFLASPNFEACYVEIYNEDDEDTIRHAFEDEIIPIPGTNQLFEIKFDAVDDEEHEGLDFTFAFKKTSA